MTTVLNFYGGPGDGKSTMAAAVFAQLKMNGHSAELVREVVKETMWRGDSITVWDEIYLFGAQLRAEGSLYGKVNYVVTDRPIGMSLAYVPEGSSLSSAVLAMIDAVDDMRRARFIKAINFHITRLHKYDPSGRRHDEASAKKVGEFCRREFPGTNVCNVGDVLQAIGQAGL